MEIIKKLTPYNYTAMYNKQNEFIVVHYVGAVSTAKNNADYLHNNSTSASAHYFVDESSIYQVVEDKDKAWHCGGGLQGSGGHYYYQKCTNSNSIGVEMCCKKNGDKWYFEADTIKNTIGLIRTLMDKYNIPIRRVIRHYDVTGKICPAPLINDDEWDEFKKKIEGDGSMTDSEREKFNLLVKQVEKLTRENDMLKKAVGWNSDDPSEPALYSYNDENIRTYISKDAPAVLDNLIKSGALATDDKGAFSPLPKVALRILTILKREEI